MQNRLGKPGDAGGVSSLQSYHLLALAHSLSPAQRKADSKARPIRVTFP